MPKLDPANLLPDNEQYQKFMYRGKINYQYDYRYIDGALFSTCAPSLKACRDRKDSWLSRRLSK